MLGIWLKPYRSRIQKLIKQQEMLEDFPNSCFARYIIGKKNRKQKSFTNVTLKHFLYAQGHCEYVVFLRGFEKVC